jgi:hypothetical protein
MHHSDHASPNAATDVAAPSPDDPITWRSLGHPACEVAKLAREMQRLYEAMGRAQAVRSEVDEATTNEEAFRYLRASEALDAIDDQIDAKFCQAVYTRASSALGAQHQVLLVHRLVERLYELTPNDDRDREARDLKRKLDWLLYSVVSVLEVQSGVPREEIGAAFYMARCQDPHLAIRSAIEVAP